MPNKLILNKQVQAAELRVKILVAELAVEQEKRQALRIECTRLRAAVERYRNVWYRRAWRWFAGAE